LGLDDQITERLDPSWCTPQVGQGALALEVRTDDVESSSAIAKLSSPSDELAVRAERAFLAELGVGCSVPAGASADVIDGVITLRAVMLSTDGSTCLRAESSSTDPIALGASLAKELRDVQGGAMLVGWREA
jgi:hydroxymethylbilane synthase